MIGSPMMMSWCPLSCHQAGLAAYIQQISLIRMLQLLLAVLILTSGVRPMVQDHCDTTVWDMGNDALGVRDVTGSCTEGHIDWRVPYGAIRISLQPTSLNHRPFEACFISSVLHTTVKFSLDDPLIGLKSLTVLTTSSPQMTRELCFVSEGTPIVLYVESELENESAIQGLVKLDYDIRRLPRSHERQSDDCRPCTDSEIIESVCTSDLVFHGSMDLVTHNAELEETLLHLKVTKMFRQRNDIFKDPHQKQRNLSRRYPRLKFHTDHGVVAWPKDEDAAPHSVTHSRQSHGVMVAPHKCGIRHGHGDFLFIGRVRFKRAFLHCAPRMDDFIAIWKKAKRTGHVMCAL